VCRWNTDESGSGSGQVEGLGIIHIEILGALLSQCHLQKRRNSERCKSSVMLRRDDW
jgi:hypothetical protein